MIVNNKENRSISQGEIKFSEEKKAIDIYTAINALYFPHYFVRPCKINGENKEEHYLVMAQNAKGTNLSQAIFVPLNSEIIYTSPNDTAVHTVNGKKIQESLGIRDNEYKEGKVCMISNEYISRIPKKSLREKAIAVWKDNLDTIEKISEAHPEFKGLKDAVSILNRSKNNARTTQSTELGSEN